MERRIEFRRNAAGGVELDAATTAQAAAFAREAHATVQPVVAAAVVHAAEAEVIRLTHEYSQRNQLDFDKAVLFVAKSNADLFALSRAVPASSRDALVVAQVAS